MKISYSWLKKFIALSETPEEVSKLLTNTGLEVEKLEYHEVIKGGLEGFVIAEVLTCDKHPGADKLKITTVDIGGGKVVPIVCGASNVDKGQIVIVATVGATIYPSTGEPFKINKAKIRGELSEGMICAEDEIGIGNSHDGILVLETALAPGTAASVYFNLQNEPVFEIGLTPNRADAASHFGVARDLRAVLKRSLIPQPFDFAPSGSTTNIDVTIVNLKDCPRYAGICLAGISVKESPAWLKLALESIGLSPINNVVDVTNYILHDLGQPLHAFDLDKIEGSKIIVQNLPENTPFLALDGVIRKLSAQDLMICDATKPIAMAGVFGGKESGVSGSTTSIFLESAYFSPGAIRKTSLHHGLKTEASFRFERGTDPNLPITALKKAVSLMIEICGGEVSSELIDVYPEPVQDRTLHVSIQRIRQLIGKDIDLNEIINILSYLDIVCKDKKEDILLLSVPPYRVDVLREADIVEEVLRIYGLNNIELSSRLRTQYIAEFPKKDKDKIQEMLSGILVSQGFFEIVTNSLTKSQYATLLGQTETSVRILNPLSEMLDVLRQSLLFTGLEVVAHNLNRQQKDLKLFEFGKIYKKEVAGYSEENRFSLLVTGNTFGETFETAQRQVDLQYIKLIVHTLLSKFGLDPRFEVISGGIYSPCLMVKQNQKVLAIFGMVQHKYLSVLDIKQAVFHVDINLDLLMSLYQNEFKFKEISRFPEVRRDLSLVLDQKITFQEINDLALKIERKLLKNLNVFDIYEGDKIQEGKKAYSVSFILQDPEQTLTEKVIDQTMRKLIYSFEKELGAVIRNKN